MPRCAKSAAGMPRVVFDTVIFVRALINPYGRWGELVFSHSDRYCVILSRPIVEEVLEVLSRSRLSEKFRVTPTRGMPAVIALLTEAEIVEPGEEPRVCRDPKDDKFLAAAASAHANYIVTEDDDLLVLGEYRGTKIIDSLTFLEMLRRSETE
jgi:uncharacterized protein